MVIVACAVSELCLVTLGWRLTSRALPSVGTLLILLHQIVSLTKMFILLEKNMLVVKGSSNISSSTAYQEQKVEVEVFLYKFSQRQRKVKFYY